MAWIESHQQLLRHPKTARLARLLGVSLPTAVGHLHCVWWWAMDYAQDGDLSHADELDIATAAMWDGDEREFFEAMLRAGFLDADPPRIHDWHDYAGRLIERRRADAARKRGGRRTESVGVPADVRRTSSGRRTDSVVTVPNPTVPNRTEPFAGAQARSKPAETAPKKRKPKTTVLPDDFQPSESTLNWARDHGWDADGFQREFEKFTGHHVAKGSTFASWDQALVNWLRRSEEFAAQKVVPIRGGQRNGAAYDEFAAALDDIISGGSNA